MMIVSIKKAAEILALSPGTVRNRIAAGEWPAFFFGHRSIRVDVDQLKELAKRNPCSIAEKVNEDVKEIRS